MQIGSWKTEDRVLVVAEIGNNHEGSFARAQDLVRAAADCGVGAVKFQTFRTPYLVSRADRMRYDRLQSFELPFPRFTDLQALAASRRLLFISTPLDLESAAFLADLVDAYKIASGDNDFYPLIERVAMTGRPVLLSSGASDLDQIRYSKQRVEEIWRGHGLVQELAILHCVSSYPTPPEQANLAAIGVLARELHGTIGYSDHTDGCEAAVLAVAAGARIIEKHFTLDKKTSAFRDHQLSADPREMTGLVRDVDRVSAMMGRGEKVVQPCERENVPLIRRTIVAAGNLAKGHRLRLEDLTWIRPSAGLRPGDEATVVGRALKRAVTFGEPVLPWDLE